MGRENHGRSLVQPVGRTVKKNKTELLALNNLIQKDKSHMQSLENLIEQVDEPIESEEDGT